jgi:hypothetical protein
VINNSKLAIIAVAAVRTASAASDYIRNFGSLLLIMTRRFYDAHMQKVQMRLAPTKWLTSETERASAETYLQSHEAADSSSEIPSLAGCSGGQLINFGEESS